MSLLSRASVLKTLNLALVFAVPPVVFLMVAATYVFAYQPLNAVFAFTVVSACQYHCNGPEYSIAQCDLYNKMDNIFPPLCKCPPTSPWMLFCIYWWVATPLFKPTMSIIPVSTEMLCSLLSPSVYLIYVLTLFSIGAFFGRSNTSDSFHCHSKSLSLQSISLSTTILGFFLFPGFLSLVLGLLEQLPFAFSSAWALSPLFFCCLSGPCWGP